MPCAGLRSTYRADGQATGDRSGPLHMTGYWTYGTNDRLPAAGDDEKIIWSAMRENEPTSDLIRRTLRLLEREVWLSRARADAERLADEDLSSEPDAW